MKNKYLIVLGILVGSLVGPLAAVEGPVQQPGTDMVAPDQPMTTPDGVDSSNGSGVVQEPDTTVQGPGDVVVPPSGE